ncbi:MAG TPA: type II toxin-antitoxin system HicB family antitoxin [Ktedonosporobacter sp.]|nr:type II toxin-antitoxin system HicB family antitoxin [Ktedonosporobacter sp.]
MKPLHYIITIQWSDRDQAYLANVPELPGCHTHGETYAEALENALEVIRLWLETARELGWPIPQPQIIAA